MLQKLKSDNAVSDRAIKQNKLAKSKKEEHLKKLKDIRDGLDKDLDDLNKEIFDKSVELEREIARFKDPELLKEATAETMQKRQEANKAKISISIAESQIKDHKTEEEMLETQIMDLLKEKRVIDKENNMLDELNNS